RAYTHTDGLFVPPANEKQGTAPKDPPVRRQPGPEVLEPLKERVNREINNLLATNRVLSQMQTHFLARAYQVKWTAAYQNPAALDQIVTGLDTLLAAYRKDPRIAEAEHSTWN